MSKCNNSEELYECLDANIKIVSEKIEQYDRAKAFEEIAAMRKQIYQGQESQPMFVLLEALATHHEGPKTDKVKACENMARSNLKAPIELMFKKESYMKQEYPEAMRAQIATMPHYFALETLLSFQLLLVTVKEQHKKSKDDGKAKDVGTLLDKFGEPFDSFLEKCANAEAIHEFRKICVNMSDAVYKLYH